MTEKTFAKRVRKLLEDNNTTGLQHAVYEDVLEEDYPLAYCKDVLTHGCQSGIVGDLIYYKDTYAFFDEHYSDIQDMLAQMADEGVPFDINQDQNIKNTGAWLAYEETVRGLLDQLEVEY